MEMDNILSLFQSKEAYNNYDTIESINDAIALLTAASLDNIPIFYRNNIIVIRQDYLQKLVEASREDSVRAAVYLFLCMLVLHAPVVPVSAGSGNGENAVTANMAIGCDDSVGITRNVLRNSFGIHRNTISKGMKLLQTVLGVVELPGTGYVFTYESDDYPDKWSTSNLRYQLNSIADAIETIQHADFFSRINPDDYIGAENAKFASVEDADYAIHNIIDDPLVPDKWKKTLTRELEKEENADQLNLDALAVTVTKLFADIPLISRCDSQYFIIRQELLEYILLHGYLPTDSVLEDTAMNKAASVILLYLISRTDELGAIYKDMDNRKWGLLQMKDIAVDCDFKLSAISVAMKYWMDIGIIREYTENGINGYRFSNQLWFQQDGKPTSYLLYRQLLKENAAE